MNKKILVSLSIIGVISAAVIGFTIAYFNDTETSTGNIFVAGSLDLKVDHLVQTYNGADCKTCSVTLVSDATNYVVERGQNAVLLTYIHPAWTAQIDCNPRDAGCDTKWIWADNPVTQYDVDYGATYTFRKTFQWWGPINDAVLSLGVAADNTYEVWLNGTKIAFDYSENNFATADTYGYAQIAPHILQGQNTLDFKVTNLARPGWTPQGNPAGLLYKLTINGNCGNDWFKTHCKLWGPKDLALGDTFWNFDDIKPGDHGTNVISLHPEDNDAWACLNIINKQDDDNGLTEPEGEAGDNTPGLGEGELSKYLSTFIWWDTNQNGAFDSGETGIDNGDFGSVDGLPLADSLNLPKLIGGQTVYIGWAWCAGDWANVPTPGQPFVCDGSGMSNKAQTDSFTADIEFYLEQWRNNPNFRCSDLEETVILEDKDSSGAIIENNDINGKFTYIKRGDRLDFSFTGKAPVINDWYALVVGEDPKNHPETAVVLDYPRSNGVTGEITISKSIELNRDLQNVQVWLILGGNLFLTPHYDAITGWNGWHPEYYLFGTGLVNYDDTNN